MALSGKLPPFFEDPSKTPRKYPQVLSHQDANGNKVEIPIEVSARGHFRRLLGHCTYPPLQLIFPKNEVQQTSIFKDQAKTIPIPVPYDFDHAGILPQFHYLETVLENIRLTPYC